MLIFCLAMAIVTSSSAAAQESSFDSGSGLVMGGAGLVMVGEEFVEMVAVTLWTALLLADGDSSQVYDLYREDDFLWNDDSHIDVEGLQAGAGVGYFIADGIAVGGRLLWQGDLGRRARRTFAGVGPELTYFPYRGSGIWKPYAGVAAIFTRDIGSEVGQPGRGTAVELKWGICTQRAASNGVYMQVNYQRARFAVARELPARVRMGVELGLATTF